MSFEAQIGKAEATSSETIPEETVDLGFDAKPRNSRSSSPCAQCRPHNITIDVLYAAPQGHRIVNVALHREYSPSIVFIFSEGRKDLYHV
jgi:DUF971 family protein